MKCVDRCTILTPFGGLTGVQNCLPVMGTVSCLVLTGGTGVSVLEPLDSAANPIPRGNVG